LAEVSGDYEKHVVDALPSSWISLGKDRNRASNRSRKVGFASPPTPPLVRLMQFEL
jgi:hypothetical protein